MFLNSILFPLNCLLWCHRMLLIHPHRDSPLLRHSVDFFFSEISKLMLFILPLPSQTISPHGCCPGVSIELPFMAQAHLQPRIPQLLSQLIPLLYCRTFSGNSMRQAFRILACMEMSLVPSLPVLLDTKSSNENNQFLRF